jgi:transcriptional regulator with XRE-family HTH domain
MPTQEEKAAFAQRLTLALRRSPEPVQGATELALRFNLRHPGAAISAQTAHKWLTGRAIPTSDKLATLADWLNVNPHWLHYGPPPAKVLHAGEQWQAYGTKQNTKPSAEAISLAQKIQALSPHRRYLVEELVEQLLRDGA